MKTTPLPLKGPLLLEPPTFHDARGFFSERWTKSAFAALDLPVEFAQDNFSRSGYAVVRGLHYQFERPQAKLVTCLHGRIRDVLVDLRRDSRTFGAHCAVDLNGESPAWLWIPPGFAHGFSVLSREGADVWYKVDAAYNPRGEGGLRWNDEELAIDWGLADAFTSDRDRALPSFADYRRDPKF